MGVRKATAWIFLELKMKRGELIYRQTISNNIIIITIMVGIIQTLLFLIFFFLLETPKISPRIDKPAEYQSPPPKKQNRKLKQEADLNIKRKEIKSEREETNNNSKPKEAVKVKDLSTMSSRELAEHVEGLRNTVKRLQETECSFVEAVEEATDDTTEK